MPWIPSYYKIPNRGWCALSVNMHITKLLALTRSVTMYTTKFLTHISVVDHLLRLYVVTISLRCKLREKFHFERYILILKIFIGSFHACVPMLICFDYLWTTEIFYPGDSKSTWKAAVARILEISPICHHSCMFCSLLLSAEVVLTNFPDKMFQ